MNTPQFYDSTQVGELYKPDINRAMRTGSTTTIATSKDDTYRSLLLLVDMQIDFIHPDGALTVPGAIEDTRRTIDWVFKHIKQITTIAASLDSHIPAQIFYPTWWVNKDGQHPSPQTIISQDDVQSGVWQPLYSPDWSKRYVQRLESQSRKQLMIWPYHTMIGSEGHNFMPALYEAIMFHSAARQTRPHIITKGLIPQTEYYSLLEPEIKIAGEAGGELNQSFLAKLETYDAIFIAGQAKSHCVLETVRSLMSHYQQYPEMIDKLHLLIDCTSSITHPDIDFDAMANDAYEGYRNGGLHLIKSDDPIPEFEHEMNSQ